MHLLLSPCGFLSLSVVEHVHYCCESNNSSPRQLSEVNLATTTSFARCVAGYFWIEQYPLQTFSPGLIVRPCLVLIRPTRSTTSPLSPGARKDPTKRSNVQRRCRDYHTVAYMLLQCSSLTWDLTKVQKPCGWAGRLATAIEGNKTSSLCSTTSSQRCIGLMSRK